MCGICGIVNFIGQSPEISLIQKMCNCLRHRGPDDTGFALLKGYGSSSVSKDKNMVGWFGHQRLSIIDLSEAGHQPMSNEDGTIWITYNGEIYNFMDLKLELQTRGHKFKSQTDTEVVLHAYEEWDVHCLHKFNGMFAFAIWDEKKEELFLARDRFGIKPLVYYCDSRTFLFASEIKSIVCHPNINREIDYEGLSFYLSFNYIPAPWTIYKCIKKLEPGHYLKLKRVNRQDWILHKIRWYQMGKGRKAGSKKQVDEIKKELFKLMEDAVKIRMISDVPLGAFLSGGIDSSIIVSLMSKHSSKTIKTFFISYRDNELFDESKFANEVVKKIGSKHYVFKLTYRDILNIIPEVLNFFDEPFADPSALPTFIVSKKAKEHVTVALSGDGGDEVFAGYNKYLAEYYKKFYLIIPFLLRKGLIEPLVRAMPDSRDTKWHEYARQLKKFIRSMYHSQPMRHLALMEIFSEEMKVQLLAKEVLPGFCSSLTLNYIKGIQGRFEGNDKVNRMLFTDVNNCLPFDMLTKVDWMSMKNSLEVRVPILDHRVVEFAFEMEGTLKLHGKKRKYILVETFKDILPKKLYNRPKQGFDIPIGEWFKKELKDIFLEVVNEKELKTSGWLNFCYIKNLFNRHISGKEDHSFRLWNLFVLCWWLRNSHEKSVRNL